MRKRVTHPRCEFGIAQSIAAETDESESIRQEFLLRQVIERWHELSAHQVSSRPENHHGAGVRPLTPQWAMAANRDRRGYMRSLHAFFTAWPPNSFRSAAMTFAENDSSCLDRSRARSDSVITGAGTSISIASCTVHRPSPESST